MFENLVRTLVALCVASVTLAACTSPPRFPDPVPEADVMKATLPNYGTIRVFPDDELVISREEAAQFALQRRAGGLKTDAFTILALSGGGSDGAFGAGFLLGWTERGDRPEFDIVTGISTGSLIAPFAFLGSSEDSALQRFYTQTTTSMIVQLAIFDLIAGGPAVGDTAPLRKLLADIVDEKFVARIAKEHQRGRRLLIGTTHLDAERSVLWDIGGIATSGNPGAPQLIRDVLLASASIPGAFPPVLIDVISNGRRYQELHVDGGVTRAIFVYPPKINMREFLTAAGLKNARKTMYLMRNGKIAPQYVPLKLQLQDIASRSISTLIKFQGRADLSVIRSLAIRDGFEYNVAFIDESFDVPSEALFDPVYMQALFDLGYKKALSDAPWSDPGFN